MSEFYSTMQLDETASTIQERTEIKPRFGLILGSGLGDLAESIEEAVQIPVGDLPFWPVSTVAGHQGRVVIGMLEEQPVIALQGRAHYYEGYSMPQVGLPVRVMQRLGIDVLIVTNAAGAINPNFEPGDLMLIVDHINFMGMSGLNPLRGPNLDSMGPRFPDMSRAYDRELAQRAREVAQEGSILLNEGVYVGVAGPSFETPAELRFLRTIGADAVGMSTVPEVTVARHGGTRVLGVSGISNKANLDGDTTTTHEEVLEAGKVIVPKLTSLLQGVIQSFQASGAS